MTKAATASLLDNLTTDELAQLLALKKADEAADKRKIDARTGMPILERLRAHLGKAKSATSDWHGAVERLRFNEADGSDWAVKIVVTAMNDTAKAKCQG
jgi:hypothetical protein